MFDHHFLNSLVEFGRVPWMELNHHWHGINVLSILEFALLAAVFFSILGLFGALVRESKRFIAISVAAALSFSTAAYAANTALSNLTASGALAGANLIYVVQTAGSGGVKATMTQVATFINSLFSGDCTATSGGALTCTKTNGTTFSSLATTTPGTGVVTALGDNVGSAGAFVVNGGALGTPSSGTLTNATGLPLSTGITGFGTGVATFLGTPSSANLFSALTTKTGSGGSAVFATGPTLSSVILATAAQLSYITGSTQCLQADTSGNVTGTGAVCGGSGSSGANPTATAGPTAVNGSATTFMRSDGAPAVQLGSASQAGIVEVDGSTITASAGVITAVPGISSRTVSGTSDTILSTDRGNIVYYTSSSSVAITQPAPTGAFASGFFTTLCSAGTGTDTITPGSGTIGGASTYAMSGGTVLNPACVSYQSNGTNFNVIPYWMVNAALLTAGTIPSARLGFGTNVFTAAANTLSSAGGLTSTVASGTAALGTGAISSATCATAVTVSATNVATTDVVSASFNGDPTAVTGYVPLTTGMLTIVGYPTSGNVNFKVCNNTSSSVTPGAITLNWRVVR